MNSSRVHFHRLNLRSAIIKRAFIKDEQLQKALLRIDEMILLLPETMNLFIVSISFELFLKVTFFKEVQFKKVSHLITNGLFSDFSSLISCFNISWIKKANKHELFPMKSNYKRVYH